ncbi:MAG: hypothetical protein POELPBGB_02102 [Bacteroidia bacterium]|nr:hypothetical protein [Bacteroidia bacterium]
MIVKSFTKAIKGISLITAGVFSFSITADAQVALLTNDGAMFYVNGATVLVDGHVDNQAGTLVNLGIVDINGNIVNDAQIGGNGSPLPGSNGLFRVAGDWRNNNLFFAGTGRVLLDGGVQGITGIAPSYFYDLELAGTDRKEIQFTDQFVTNTLILNDRELWTDQYTMHVENTNAGAITRTTGFVSSLEAGSLSRKTLSSTPYLFPVGSTQNTPRYRPVFIEPTTSFPNTFTVRLVNANPITDDQFDPTDYAKDPLLHDPTVCYVNDNYWYKINHPEGTDNADLSLSYDAAFTDDQGAYNAIAQWDSITDNRWENLGFPNTNYLTADPNDPTTLTFVKRNAVTINNTLPEPYTLAYLIPPAPEQFGDSIICADVQTTYSIIPNTNGTYEFFVDSTEGTIISTTATSATVIWNDVPFGTINVIETIDNQNGYVACPSLVGSFLVDILSLPDAIFGTTYEYPNPNPNGTYGYNNPDDVFINDLISFHDSSTNTVSWFWDFNDGVNSVNQNPYHTYSDLGTYNVMMVATSPDGCLDTAYKTINVVEGLIVPNVFTPNGDGYNDVFKIRNSAVSEFTFRVFNRWGTQIYETTAPEIAWDGKTTAGSAAPAGTYFYTLDAKLESGNDIAIFQDKDTLEKGHITLIR